METNQGRVAELQQVGLRVGELDRPQALALLETLTDEETASVLASINPSICQDLLYGMDDVRRQHILSAAPPEVRQQWTRNHEYLDRTIGRLMEPALAVFRPETTIREAIEALRPLVKRALITYLFVTDPEGRLLGVVAMRELALGNDNDRLDSIMIRNPFALKPDMELLEAMKSAVVRHFPVYPVCDPEGRLVGAVRGQMLFEAEAIELSAQAGKMVGVEKEERLVTPWTRSLKFRHPWLQLNLFTAFIAAGVVALFEPILDKVVLLAVFLPVLAGQSGNTGCQALAVTLRGITLGELKQGGIRRLLSKEALLGVTNGCLVGITASIGMFIYATSQKHPAALTLSFVVLGAMMMSCLVSGLSGVLVPLTLRKLGADPATASSIFLTTATDVVSMGAFLGLATLLVP